MNFPAKYRYTEDHEWVHLEGGNVALVGITDFAQSELGELVYIEVETVGDVLNAHEIFGTVEAVKTTSDLFMPIKGKVVEFNAAVDDARHRRKMHADVFGNILEHHWLDVLNASIEKVALPIYNLFAHAIDGLFAMLNVFQQVYG